MSDGEGDVYTAGISLLAVRGIKTKRAEQAEARAAQEAAALYTSLPGYGQPFPLPPAGQPFGQPQFPPVGAPPGQWAPPPPPLMTGRPRNAA